MTLVYSIYRQNVIVLRFRLGNHRQCWKNTQYILSTTKSELPIKCTIMYHEKLKTTRS
jgi:hypothetical protein